MAEIKQLSFIVVMVILSPHREVRVHRPLYAGQCLSGIIKSAAAAAADDHNHAALSNDQRSAWAGRPSARPGPYGPGI